MTPLRRRMTDDMNIRNFSPDTQRTYLFTISLRVNIAHPDTGRPIVGTPIPGWSRLKEIVLAAAPIFAGIHTQSWDVALTEHGPVLLELNFGGDLNLAQLATGKGILDDDYLEHLQEWGYHH